MHAWISVCMHESPRVSYTAIVALGPVRVCCSWSFEWPHIWFWSIDIFKTFQNGLNTGAGVMNTGAGVLNTGAGVLNIGAGVLNRRTVLLECSALLAGIDTEGRGGGDVPPPLPFWMVATFLAEMTKESKCSIVCASHFPSLQKKNNPWLD